MIIPDEEEMRRLALQVGVCPYCKKNLLDPQTADGKVWRHCCHCHIDFEIEQDPDATIQEGK